MRTQNIILIISLAYIMIGCSGGGSGGSSTTPQIQYENLDGVWTKSIQFVCYDPTLTTLTYNGSNNNGVQKTLTISGQSMTLEVVQISSGTVFCDGTYSANIYALNGTLVLDNVSLTDTDHPGCVFGFNNPSTITPSSRTDSVNGTIMIQNVSNLPFKLSGNTLAFPLVVEKPVGRPNDTCFDIYTK